MSESLKQSIMDGKHVVIFGAGYIGGRVASAARQAGARVTALTRNPDRLHELRGIGCAVVEADAADREWHPLIAPADYVLNCLSSGRRGLVGYQRSYAEAAASILEWGNRLGAESMPLVYTSSTSVYPQSGGQAVDETCPVAGGDERSRILIETEEILQQWAGPCTVLRLAGIYGPDRHFLLDQLQAHPAEVPGRGGHHLNLIHRDDIVQAILLSWAQPHPPQTAIFNVVDEGQATRAEVVTWLAQRMGIPVPVFSGQNVAGRRAVRPDRILLNSKLKTELKWQPRYPTFREGYEALLDGA